MKTPLLFFLCFILSSCSVFSQGKVKPLFQALAFASYERNDQNKPEAGLYISINNTGSISIVDKMGTEPDYYTYILPDSTIRKLNTIFDGSRPVQSYQVTDELGDGFHYAGDYSFIAVTNKDNKTEYLAYITPFMSDDFNEVYMEIIMTFSLKKNRTTQVISIPKAFLDKLSEYDQKAVNLPQKELPPPAAM